MLIDPSLAINAGVNQSDLPSDLKGACKAMEEQFIVTLLSTMRKSALASQSKGSLGFSKDVAYSMFDGQVAKSAVDGEGVGLWRTMLDQLDQDGDGEGDASSKNGSSENGSRGVSKTVGHIIR